MVDIKPEAQRWRDWAAGGLLLLAVLVLFLPALVHPSYFLYPTFSPHSDVTVIHWPKAHLMSQNWQTSRSLPSWNPANLSGMPLVANQLAMRLYPPAWLFLVLPINPVFNLLFVFHLFLGGLGVYWLLRSSLDLDPIPALVGGLTFGLSGKLLAHAAGGHVSMVAAVAWMPWALGGLAMLLRQGRARWAILAAVALAMQITTHTLITLYTGYLLAAYTVWHVVSRLGFAGWKADGVDARRAAAGQLEKRPKSAAHRPPGRLTAWAGDRAQLALIVLFVPVLAALLGAVQLLPLAELARYSNRALSIAEASEFALSPLALAVGLFLPSSQGGHEMVVYLGLVPLLLAGWGLHRADRRSWFFGMVVVLAAIFALGQATPLFELAYRWGPGLRWVRTPARAFLVAALAVAALAGMGAQRLADGQARWSGRLALAIGSLTLALGLGLAALYGVNRAVLGLAFLPLATLVIIGFMLQRRLPPRLALVVLACLLFIDLASFDAAMMRFVSPAAAFASGERVAGFLARQPGLFRTYSPSYSIPSHTAARAGLQTADGVEPVHLAAYDRYMEAAGGYGHLFQGEGAAFSVTVPRFPPGQPIDEALRGVRPDLTLLGLLNVEYVIAAFPMNLDDLVPVSEPDATYVYHNRRALPRAWVIPGHPTAALQCQVGDEGWLKRLTALADQAAASVAAGEYPVAIIGYQPDRIVVDANLPQPGLLVMGEMWYPGWHVTVDGEPHQVQPVCGLLRGVTLDAGAHRVLFQYDPASLRHGTWLSLAACAGLALAGASTVAHRLVSRRARQRRERGLE